MSEKILDINEIMKWLPHRYPFVMIDRVVDYDLGNWIKAYKNVTINEQYFTGHFPGRPVMPGVLILEALAQTGGMLTLLTANDPLDGEPFYYIGVNNARFKRVVVPGDRLDFEVKILKVRQGVSVYEGVASVDGEIACKAEFMLKRG